MTTRLWGVDRNLWEPGEERAPLGQQGPQCQVKHQGPCGDQWWVLWLRFGNNLGGALPRHSLPQIPSLPEPPPSLPNRNKTWASAECLGGLGSLQSAASVEGWLLLGADTWASDASVGGAVLAPVSEGLMLHKEAECSCSGLTELSGCFSPPYLLINSQD